MELLIGEANYSTWSMRPWLFLSGFNVNFTTRHISLVPQNTLRARLLEYSPAAKVPILIDDDIVIWDTLAICEYISENYLADTAGRGLPPDKKNRATARAIIAEMHSGFSKLRQCLPMNIRAQRLIDKPASLLADIKRIDEIWSAHHPHSGWLFDKFSMADCFYAPVVMRFKTYGVSLSPKATAYYEHVRDCEVVQKWCAMAHAETTIVPMDELGYPQ